VSPTLTLAAAQIGHNLIPVNKPEARWNFTAKNIANRDANIPSHLRKSLLIFLLGQLIFPIPAFCQRRPKHLSEYCPKLWSELITEFLKNDGNRVFDSSGWRGR
jgi:hypothetical protein